MPQEQNILRCYSCETFQAHIVKKNKKWDCKICGAKQTFKRHFGRGNGKECRIQVQKLNEMRMTRNDEVENELLNESSGDERESMERGCLESQRVLPGKTGSKWDLYLEREKSDSEEDDETQDWVSLLGKRVLTSDSNARRSKMLRCNKEGKGPTKVEEEERMVAAKSAPDRSRLVQSGARTGGNAAGPTAKAGKYARYLTNSGGEGSPPHSAPPLGSTAALMDDRVLSEILDF